MTERETCGWCGRFLSEDKQIEEWWYSDFPGHHYGYCNMECKDKYYNRLGEIIEEDQKRKLIASQNLIEVQ